MKTQKEVGSEKPISSEEKVFERIQLEAKKNMQPIPFRYIVETKYMYCEIEGKNPSMFAEKIDGEWIVFFEM